MDLQQIICIRCNPSGDLGLCEKCSIQSKEEKYYETITRGQGTLAQVRVQHNCEICSKVLRPSHYGMFIHDGKIYHVDCLSMHNIVNEVIIDKQNFDVVNKTSIKKKEKILQTNDKIKITRLY
ncbi:unnamed protein product [Adineta steineri]|uniref:Uncharacterized protein n=1 Tax=Adineta steineri TaxID=433720 RepID=A0A813XP35_9BILA|nr:unnamed protein product [Adineta steineri]